MSNDREGATLMKGNLRLIRGYAWLGRQRPFDFFECQECKTTFPSIDGQIRCNGRVIDRCPWCREDSEPWKNGRGI
jgi:hypothetical protein